MGRAWIWALVGVVVLGGALRAGSAVSPDAFRSVDEQGYVSAAIGLAETGRYGREDLHWPPGAPVAFAAAAELDGHDGEDIAAAYWVQWLAGTALIGVVFALAATLAGPAAGLAAAALVATYPPLIGATGDLLTEPLGALWLTAALLALVRRRLVLGGLLLAAAVLTRANLLVLVPVLALVLGPRPGLRFAVAALIPVAAWSLHAGVPVSTGGGSALFVGTYLPGEGTLSGTKRALGGEGFVLDQVAARHPGLDRDAALRREAWRNVTTYPRADPAGYAAMVAAKLPRLWSAPSLRPGLPRTTLLRAWHLALVVAAFAGLLLARNPVLLAALLTLTAFHLVVEAIPRYALPALPALVAAGAAGWARWLAARRARRTGPAPPDWPASPAPRPSRPASPSVSA